MRLCRALAAGLALLLVGTSAWAQGRSTAPRKAPAYQRGFGAGLTHHRALNGNYGYSPYLAPSYAWPGHHYGAPYSYWPNYSYSSYSSYLYFYDLYYREAERSKQEADEFEASLEREGKLTGPAKVGALPGDFLPLAPRDVTLTLDGGVQIPSSSGGPIVIGSGHHTLRVSAKPPIPGETRTPSHQGK